MNQLNEKEMSSDQTTTSQSDILETETISVSSITKDYIINSDDVQDFSLDYEFFDGRKPIDWEQPI